MSRSGIYTPPSFDPTSPDAIQIAAFGPERLDRDAEAPYSQDMLDYLTFLVVDLSTQPDSKPGRDGTVKRNFQQDPSISSSPYLTIGYNVYPTRHSLVSTQSSAFVHNAADGREFRRPQGYGRGFYSYWENLFVQEGSQAPVVERNVMRNPILGKPIFFRAFKLASELDLMATSAKVVDYGLRNARPDVEDARFRLHDM